jgi:cytochrome c-type biogenesis protein CcmE
MQVKLLIGGVIAAAAIGYLAYAGVSAGQAFCVEVDVFLADEALHSQRVRLVGKVSEDNVTIGDGDNPTRFDLVSQADALLPVEYRGPVPGMFKPGGNVLVDGRLENGVFVADQLLTKCASKYEDHSQRLENPQ